MFRILNKRRELLGLVVVLAAVAVLVPLWSKTEEESLAGKRVCVNGIRWGSTVDEESHTIAELGLVEQVRGQGANAWESPSNDVVMMTIEGHIVGVMGDRLTVDDVVVLKSGQRTTEAPKNLDSAFQRLAWDKSGQLFGIAATETGEQYLIRFGIWDGKFARFSAEEIPTGHGGLPAALFD